MRFSSFVAAFVFLLNVGVSVRADDSPLDLLNRSWSTFAEPGDALGYPMKVRAIAQSPYHFWRGGKDFFFAWVKENTPALLAAPAYPAHGDLHFGNLGVYASEKTFGDVAFGMTDFDDATQLPIAMQLLDGAITLRLAARDTATDFTADDARIFTHDLVEAYRSALTSSGTATDQLKAIKPIAKLLKKASKNTYHELLNKMTEQGKFRPLLKNKEGDVTNILRPALEQADDIAEVIAQAAVHSPRLAAMMRYTDAKTIRSNIRDVALRTRLGSSGSQGLRKVLVLLDKPLKSEDHDVIFYLKQEIPAAAERQGAVPAFSESPGQRVSDMCEALCDPDLLACSWGDAAGRSYWVQIYEPWSDDLQADDFGGLKGLSAGATGWGTTLGTMHREKAAEITPQLTADLERQINEQADLYVAHMLEAYEAFRKDPRVRALQIEADKVVMEWTK